MVTPVWWLRSLIAQTGLLLASWPTRVRALLHVVNLLALMSFLTSNVLIPCADKDPRLLQEFQLLQHQMGENVAFKGFLNKFSLQHQNVVSFKNSCLH